MKPIKQHHSEICFSSVEQMPEAKGSVAFITDSARVFKDDIDISPITLTDGTQYMPWGGDNMMPYNILGMIEKDETLATCKMFNAEVCYGSGLVYNTDGCSSSVKEEVDDFLLTNSLPSYFLGVCQDFKHFGWCVSVIILDNEGKHIVGLYRKEVCYCRFSPANSDGHIEYVLYANWNKSLASIKEVEKIPLLSFDNPWGDLQQRLQKKNSPRKYAIVCRVPTPDSTYYPIPYYAALFKGNWYNIKQLVGIAKEAKLKNSAPLKYHIEVSQRYWEGIFKRECITDIKKQQARVVKEKHPDALLLFRSGDVYKCYEEDAIKAAEVLCLTNIVEEYKITIASFPHHCLDTYLPKLIRHGIRVAICDDITDFCKPAKHNESANAVQQELFLRS